MLKNIVKNKIITSGETKDSFADNTSQNLAVNAAIQVAPLIDQEEEKLKEEKFKNDHVEYLRVTRKPLLFGLEEQLTYTQHEKIPIEGCLQNFNNK